MLLADSPFVELAMFYAVAIAIVSFLIHLAFAIGVGVDTRDLMSKGGRTVFVSPPIWTLATLVGGPLVAASYWVVHYMPAKNDPRVVGK